MRLPPRPCATQNELDEGDARTLAANGCRAVIEGANMPCTPEAIAVLRSAGVVFAPGKAANAGGVATAGLEMAQNATFSTWTRDEVDQRLHAIMTRIHRTCVETATAYGHAGDLAMGANIGGFLKVARATIEQGLV